MGAAVTSTVLDQEHIDELLRRSKTKPSHLGKAWKKLHVYHVGPDGVCMCINDLTYLLEPGAWREFPPSQDAILDAVDNAATDSGHGASVTNLDARHYPFIVEHFANTGLKYKLLQLIPKPDGSECVCLSIRSKTELFLSESGCLSTFIRGERRHLDHVLHVMRLEAPASDEFQRIDNTTGSDTDIVNYAFCTPFWAASKTDMIAMHHTLLKKFITGEFKGSITKFMHFETFSHKVCREFASAIAAKLSHKEPSLTVENIERFLLLTSWPNILARYCHERLPLSA